MLENRDEAKGILNNKARWVLTLALGMLVIIWRLILPITVSEITTATVLATAGLDLALTAALIFINRNELKEAFFKKFALKDLLMVIGGYVAFFIFTTASSVLLGLTGMIIIESPAAWVAEQYSIVFPIGLLISVVIAAPIWEEIAFRMAGRNLIKNKFLFVLITTFLFVLVHSGIYLIPSVSGIGFNMPFVFRSGMTYVFAGIGYAVIYLVAKDIRIAMGVHLLNNLIVAMFMLFG